ncbi:MAG: GNAT family N-acetyltransferase [Actinomycetota bacterium]|nr:GNAT family N-acetyltransferase [Actinomycetota bacterium]
MPRRRVAVALLPPPGLARSLQTLRRAVDDPRLDDLPPHLTLVPPINLAATAYDEARLLLRSVASSSGPIELEVGPAATFAPATPTLHLELRGELDALGALRERVRSGPFQRRDVWPFHPHLTLREELLDPPPALAAAVLSGRLGGWTVDRLNLLEQRRDDVGRRSWVPVIEEPFGPAVVVGRGGVELELRATTMLDESAAVLTGAPSPLPDPCIDALVVTAVHPGARPGEPPLGVVSGRLDTSDAHGVAHLECVVVDPGSRGFGIGRHLLRRWCHEAGARGAQVALTDSGSDASTDGLLESDGFVTVGSTRVRQLVAE